MSALAVCPISLHSCLPLETWEKKFSDTLARNKKKLSKCLCEALEVYIMGPSLLILYAGWYTKIQKTAPKSNVEVPNFFLLKIPQELLKYSKIYRQQICKLVHLLLLWTNTAWLMFNGYASNRHTHDSASSSHR